MSANAAAERPRPFLVPTLAGFTLVVLGLYWFISVPASVHRWVRSGGYSAEEAEILTVAGREAHLRILGPGVTVTVSRGGLGLPTALPGETAVPVDVRSRYQIWWNPDALLSIGVPISDDRVLARSAFPEPGNLWLVLSDVLLTVLLTGAGLWLVAWPRHGFNAPIIEEKQAP